MRRRREFDIFSLSFLDVITCGFGAVLLLILLAKDGEFEDFFDVSQAQALLQQIAETETRLDRIAAASESLDASVAGNARQIARLETRSGAAAQAVSELDRQLDIMDDKNDGLRAALESMRLAALRASNAPPPPERDDEVGGIPVDSDYIIFIIDTSGSMRSIWSTVVAQMENILDIHPDVRGFQIMNDMGNYLRPGSRGRWIEDTGRQRASALRLLRQWQSNSNSSPVEGLEEALRTYAEPGTDLAIYILGDEYNGGGYDTVIETLNRINTNRITGERLARVHAIGFTGSANTTRFSTLMREVARQNNGTFVGIPR